MNRSKIIGALTGGVIAAGLLVSGVAFAAPSPHAPATAPGQNKIQCFDGTTDGGFGGVCTLNSSGAKGSATLNNSDSNANGDYSGVFIGATTITGQTLGNITQLGYTYSGTVTPNPGDLSLNVPVDTNNDGLNDAYLFIDAFYCPGNGGVVDVIHDTNCGIFVNNVEYSNWAALVAANPTWKVTNAGDAFTGTLPFVIAERTPSEGPAIWTVSNVTLGKGGK
jgi:hypothetical protein